MNRALGSRFKRPITNWSSTLPSGHTHVRIVIVVLNVKEKVAAMRRIGEGVDDQKKPS
jgi:hypothetical protein